MENIFFDTKLLQNLGQGAIIGKTVRIRRPTEVSIGDGTIIDDFTYISGSAEIGAYCHISSNTVISGGKGHLKMGNYVGIGAGCSIHLFSSDFIKVSLDLPSVLPQFRFGGGGGMIEINDFVLLGAHTVVLPGVILPEGFATAAGTIVRKRHYEPWTLYGGYDCQKLCSRDNKDFLARKDGLLAVLRKPIDDAQ